MPKVSVIIPTRNRAEFLCCAIKSVLNQSVQDFEIIVIDDASQDTTQEVVANFGDKRIRYICHRVAKGVAAARNTGVLQANGDYIAFLDDDDEWFAEKLRMQLDVFEKSPQTVGGVYTGSVQVERFRKKIIAQKHPCKRGRIFTDMFFDNWIGPTSTVILRRECFQNVGLFDVTLGYGEDYDMWVRVSKEYDFDYVETPLVQFHYHRNGLSHNYDAVIKGREAFLKKYAEVFARNRKLYSNRLLGLGVYYCYVGNVKKGRLAFRQAIKLDPFELRNYFNLCLSLFGARYFKKAKEFKDNLGSKLHLVRHFGCARSLQLEKAP